MIGAWELHQRVEVGRSADIREFGNLMESFEGKSLMRTYADLLL